MVDEQLIHDLLLTWYISFGDRRVDADEIQSKLGVNEAGDFGTKEFDSDELWDAVIDERGMDYIRRDINADAKWWITEKGIKHLQQHSSGV